MPVSDRITTGYNHPDYAKSLSEFGVPRLLDQSNGWILKRKIPNHSEWDAIGCYPLFSCEDWSQLHKDLDGLDGEIVSLSIVTDPFGDYDEIYLRQCFAAIVFAFKEHFVTDLEQPIDAIIGKHHLRNAKKARKQIEVEICENPVDHADEWFDLYLALSKRHAIQGIAGFSRLSLRQQLEVPGIVMLRAVNNNQTVGMLLWYMRGNVAYYHLGAYTDLGYELRASFALFWFAIQHFSESGLKWLALGAGAGSEGSGTDGLTRFKSGWATGTKTAYFCGRIYDQVRYSELVNSKVKVNVNYFPAYRTGEFS